MCVVYPVHDNTECAEKDYACVLHYHLKNVKNEMPQKTACVEREAALFSLYSLPPLPPKHRKTTFKVTLEIHSKKY